MSNLYVAGPCVIPNATFSNPTLPACAIAIRTLWKGLGLSIGELRKEVGLPGPSEPREWDAPAPTPRT